MSRLAVYVTSGTPYLILKGEELKNNQMVEFTC